MLPHSDTANRNTFALAGLRIAVGCLFLIFAQYKVFGMQFTQGGGFQWWINRFLQDGGAYPFMVPVLQRVVLPHATAIAFLVAYGELAIGLALVLGIWVRTASVFGFFYMLSLLFSSNYPGTHVPLWQYFGASLDHSVLALCFVTFFSSRSDEALSLRLLWRRPPGQTARGVAFARSYGVRSTLRYAALTPPLILVIAIAVIGILYCRPQHNPFILVPNIAAILD